MSAELRDVVVRRRLEVDRLAFAPGRVTCVLGGNGAGKSTLVRALAMVQPVDRGTVLLGGEPLTERRARREVAAVLQRTMLCRGTVAMNVGLPLRFRGLEPGGLVDEWLERLGIAHLRDRPVDRLSGGEARRVSLARGFACSPRLLLLDEPFAGLDHVTRHGLLADLGRLLRAQAGTTVLVTHDPQDVMLLADDLAILREGRVVAEGTASALLTSPPNAYAARLLGYENVTDAFALRSRDLRPSDEPDAWRAVADRVVPGRDGSSLILRVGDAELLGWAPPGWAPPGPPPFELGVAARPDAIVRFGR